MAIQGFFTGDVKIRDLNGVLKAVDGIVEVATDAGTVTSVGIQVGSTGTDVNVANSPVTTSGNITLNLPTASATNRGLLSSADWAIFDAKQGSITLTTTGNNGSATLTSGTLNIPTYTLAGLGGISLTSLSASSPLAYNNTTGAFSIQVANGSQNGYLSSSDWTTFNSKQSALTFSSPLVNSSGTVSIPAATSSVNGYLTSTDWATFNNKQGAITLTTTGSSGAATLIGTTLNIPNYSGALTGYVPYTGATGNVDLGEYGISSGYFQADLTPSGTLQVGRMQWNSTDGTMDLRLMGNNVTLQIGQEQVARVVNGTGVNLLESNYQAVKIIGAQGQRLQVGLARADNDANSKDTLGLVTENINNNQEGFITVSGLVNEINTTGSLQGETWADGDTLYLSGTTSGAITNVKPTAPIHTVIVGFVVYAHANHGKIFVKVDNGYELEELHDVAPTPYVNKGVLYRDTATNLWKSATIGTLLGYTPANAATTLTINGTAYDLSANRTWNVGTVTSIGTSGPLTGGTITGSGTIGITQATTSTDGYLSSTDWNTFNNKQAAGSYITALTGEATATGPGSASVTLSTSAVTGKLLTGLNLTGGGSIAATDSILQAFGKVQNQISGLAGGVTYQGTWNASTNTPTLTSSVGTKGYYYIVDVAGSTNLNGITDWKIGDWAIFNGSTWDKVDNTDAVSSVNGFTGAVSLTTSNIAEGTNLYYLDSRARLSLSFTAGSGAYNNTTGVITIPTNTSQLTNGANFITLSSLSASSPLSYNNGTGALSIQVANGSQNGYLSSSDWTTFNSKQPAGNYVTTDTVQTITALKTFTSKVTLNTGGTDDQMQIVGAAPSVRLTNAVTGATINGFIAMAGAANNYIQGAVSGDMTIGNQNNGKILFGFGSGTATQKMSLDSSGNAVLAGGLTLGSTLSNGTYTYTLPSATGTLALTSQLTGGTVTSVGLSSATSGVTIGSTPITTSGTITLAIATASGSQQGLLSSTDWTTFNNKQNALTNPVTGTGTTNYLPKFTGTSTIGNSALQDDGVELRYSGADGFRVQGSTSGFLSIYGTSDNYIQFVDAGGAAGYIRYNHTSDAMSFRTNGTDKMFLNSSGNLGLGVNPSAWSSAFGSVLQFKSAGSNGGGALTGSGGSNFRMFANTFYDGSYKYIVNGTATQYEQDGYHAWYTAPSGTAGNAISFTQAMTLNASGNLSIGNTNDTYKLDVSGTGRFTGAVQINNNTTGLILNRNAVTNYNGIGYLTSGVGQWFVGMRENLSSNNYIIYNENGTDALTIAKSNSAATFSSSVTIGGAISLSNNNVFPSGAGIFQGTGYLQMVSGADGFTINNNANTVANVMVTNAGNVGIGTTSPNRALHVVGGIELTSDLVSTKGGTTFRLGYDAYTTTSGVNLFTESAVPLVFGTASTERMRITSGGALLVNRTSIVSDSTYKFAVRNSTNVNIAFGIQGGEASIESFNDAVSAGMPLRIYGEPLQLYTAGIERMRITSGGQVNLGSAANYIGVGNDGGGVYLETVGNADATRAARFQVGNFNFSQYSSMSIDGANQFVRFSTANTERMRITSGGNLLVGTTSDNNSRVQVQGQVRTTGGYIFDNQTGSGTFTWYGFGGNIYAFSSSVGNLATINGSTGAYTATSDINKKKDFELSNLGLDAVMGLKPTLYRMKSEYGTQKHLGFIAQEVKDYIPQAYVESGNFIGLSEMPLIAALTKAVQEQQAQIEKLKSQLNK